MPVPVALDLFTDVSGFVRETLWVVAAIIAATAIMVYILAWMSRYFIYLKAQESRYFDARTLDIIHRVVELLAIAIWLLSVMAIAAIRSPEVRNLLVEFFERFWAVMFAVLILVAFVGAVDILPPAVPEKAFLEGVRANLTTPSSTLFVATAIAVGGAVLAFGLARLSDSVFDDMKQRSKKYGPRVLDQFKAAARVAIYLLSFVVVLFLELGLVLTAEQMLAVAVAFVLVVVVGVVVSFDALRNAFAGLALLQADPYGVGDRVKIGEDLVGDVTTISLTMTILRTGRGETVTLPNRHVLSSPVLNFTRSVHHAIFVEVAVGWDVPHKTVEQLLLDAAKSTPGVLESPPPQVFGKDATGNAIVHQLLAYTNDPERMKQVKSALLYTIQDLFHEKKLKTLASGP